MIFILDRQITKKELNQALEVYSDYIKAVIDIDRNILAIGGEFHIDCEEVLLKNGSKQSNLYGGGYRVSTKEVEFSAMSNYKPSLGKLTYEIADEKIRKQLVKLTKELLEV